MKRRRWLIAIVVGMLCGVTGPVLGVFIFPAFGWLTDLWHGGAVTRWWHLGGVHFAGSRLLDGVAFVIACFIILPGPSGAVLSGLGTWVLLRARERGSRLAALSFAGAAGGFVLGGLSSAASPLGVYLLVGDPGWGNFVLRFFATGAIVGALLGLAVWVSLRPSPQPSP